ncbi:MAG: response regulator [Bacteroidetes bacterium]|nr:response regulator [Bacteroidota bacterium]
MRKIAVVSHGKDSQKFMSSAVEGLGELILLDYDAQHIVGALSAQKISVVVCCCPDWAVMAPIMATHGHPQYIALLDPMAPLPENYLELGFSDEMGLLPGDTTATLLRKKIVKLLDSRWNQRVLSLSKAMLASYQYPLVCTYQSAPKAPKAVYFNDAFLKASGHAYERLNGKAFDIFDYYGIDRVADFNPESNVYHKPCFTHPAQQKTHNCSNVQVVSVKAGENGNAQYHIAIETLRIVDNDLINELKNNKYDLEKRLKTRDEFLASITHDIRKPLNNIIGLIELLQESDLDQEQRYLGNSIAQSSRNLRILVNDLLDLSKIGAGNFEITNAFFDLEKFFANLETMFREEARAKALIFGTQIAEGVPAMLLGDENRLLQVMVNLLSNAFKFTESGSVRVEANLLSMSDRQARIEIKVTDTGTGIPPEDHVRIFQSFEQSNVHIGKKYGGTGLGLSICDKLTHLMGGSIKLESSLGKGSTFLVQLPFGLAPVTNPEGEINGGKDLDDMDILIVDDSELTNFVLERLLTRWNARVASAKTGKEALALVGQKHYHCILTDVQLPDMNGVLLANRLKSTAARRGMYLPVMGISAFPFPSKLLAKSHFDHFMLKPIDPDKLYDQLIKIQNEPVILSQGEITADDMDYQVINALKIKAFANNDAGFISELVGIFKKRTPEYFQELRQAVENSDYERIKSVAHKLKPTFTYVGMEDFTQKVGSLELLAEKKDKQSIMNVLDDVWNQCQLAFHEFDDLIKTMG